MDPAAPAGSTDGHRRPRPRPPGARQLTEECIVAGGQVVAEAVLFGTPEGIFCRVTLTQPGYPERVTRHDVWEQLMGGLDDITALVKRFWEDPAGLAIRPH